MTSRVLVKGILLSAPFLLLFGILFLFGSGISRFFGRLFAGPEYEDHLHGPYTIFVRKGSPYHVFAAQVLDEFTEQMVAKHGTALRLVKPDPNYTAITVHLLDSHPELEKSGLSEVHSDLANNGGYFLPAKRKIALVVRGDPEIDARGLRHEMMHALMALSAPDAAWPAWLAEGMASHFESSRSIAWKHGGGRFDGAGETEVLPLTRILESKSGDFSGEQNRLFYQSSRLLVGYLVERRYEEFLRFYRSAIGGGGDAFSATFGPLEQVEADWKAYVESLR